MSTEKIKSPRLSTYMSLDCSGVSLKLYLSGVYVYRDDLHRPHGMCVIRYQEKNIEYGRRLKRPRLSAHRHIIWGLESNLAFAFAYKAVDESPAKSASMSSKSSEQKKSQRCPNASRFFSSPNNSALTLIRAFEIHKRLNSQKPLKYSNELTASTRPLHTRYWTRT